MTTIESDDEIRQRIEKRYKKRQELINYIASFIIINAILWVFFGRDSWIIWITFAWGIGVFFKILNYYNEYGPGAQHKESQIQREIAHEHERLGYEKPKNDVRMRLTDDGEIEEVPEDEMSIAEKRKRN